MSGYRRRHLQDEAVLLLLLRGERALLRGLLLGKSARQPGARDVQIRRQSVRRPRRRRQPQRAHRLQLALRGRARRACLASAHVRALACSATVGTPQSLPGPNDPNTRRSCHPAPHAAPALRWRTSARKPVQEPQDTTLSSLPPGLRA